MHHHESSQAVLFEIFVDSLKFDGMIAIFLPRIDVDRLETLRTVTIYEQIKGSLRIP